MSKGQKRRDGFVGERFINLPLKVLEEFKTKKPMLSKVYITEIGYFPKASHHYRERRKGCSDSILIYCVQGKGHYILDNLRYEVNANQYFIIPTTDKYMRYWADKDNPWTIYWLHYTGDKINIFNESLHVGLTRGPVRIPFNDKAIEIWKNIYETFETGYNIDNLCSANFCFYHLMATFLFPQRHIGPSKGDDDMVTLTINYMLDHLSGKLTVSELAERQSLSSSHFTLIFNRATGMPPIDYFIHLKMQKACQLLYGNEERIKSIASQLGFQDAYYFSRMFKKFIGSSPQRYREQSKSAG